MKPEIRTEQGRLADGRFRPGCSGNAGGRPTVIRHVQDLARQHTAAAIATLKEVMANPRAPAAARVAAAGALLDRGWGKPPAHVEIDGTQPKESPLRAILAIAIADATHKLALLHAPEGEPAAVANLPFTESEPC